jgi:predicted unusual protein kinase regulating ubiquinone biosynthesis (AarF/ABC1/UbiB family)
VRVPRVYWELCSPRVLTLEYLPGIKISDSQRLVSANLDTQLIARRATEAYLQQILRHGFFHADPHPGAAARAGPRAAWVEGSVGGAKGGAKL